MSRSLAIETLALTKHFGRNRAVDGVDLAIPQGMVYGVLGPNGAGKTTTLRMLATLLPPTSGAARVLGHDVAKEPHRVRARISLTGQFASVDEDLTGRENLRLLAKLLGFKRHDARERADELLQAFQLEDAAQRQVKFFSGGMRRRLDIASSLVVTPDLLFLDEPTTGLDPRSRNQVWDIIRALVGQGTTVLLTTQYLEEADQLAERIAVIDHGRVIAEGTPAELKRSIGKGVLHVRLEEAGQRLQAADLLRQQLGIEPILENEPEALNVPLADTTQATAALQTLMTANIALTSFSLGQPSMDEVFMALTGRPPEAESDPSKEASA
ncbi:MAG: ATP-binding cassette domain-containing protein [Natronospirillum sp.]